MISKALGISIGILACGITSAGTYWVVTKNSVSQIVEIKTESTPNTDRYLSTAPKDPASQCAVKKMVRKYSEVDFETWYAGDNVPYAKKMREDLDVFYRRCGREIDSND